LVRSCDLYFAPKGFKESAKQTFPAVETLAAEIGHFAESLINGTVQSIQPKKVVMFWKSFLKLQKALMNGRCLLPKNSK